MNINSFSILNFTDIISINLLLSLILLCLLILSSKSKLIIIFGLSSVSALVCIFYLILDAADVALTEASINAATSTVFIILLAKKVQISTDNPSERPSVRIYAGILATLSIVYLFYKLSPVLPEFGNKENIIHLSSEYYLQNTLKEINIPAFVTAILGDYRAFDTMLETIVIFTAGLGVYNIVGVRYEK
ncbi:MAG: hydrogenase subunit MbhD domain-containing protein [Rickettsiaceae bacterium]|nr:hydrogenase subunit MbhD domain-containing protein [Rickettsiaceae bacterium]